MSLGMFCAIPLPYHLWDDSCVNLMLPFFPLVGALIGVIWWGIVKLLLLIGIHMMLIAAVSTVIPFIITGFLHLDGYMDTNDAVLSRRPLEDKLRILKDPRAGAFAVISVAVLFILQFAAIYTVTANGKYLALLIVMPVISRCCSAFVLLALKPMPQSGYANMFRQNSGLGQKVCILIIAILAAWAAFLFAGIRGVAVTAVVIAGYAAAMAYVYHDLKGVSGDLAGYALVIGELCGLTAIAVI